MIYIGSFHNEIDPSGNVCVHLGLCAAHHMETINILCMHDLPYPEPGHVTLILIVFMVLIVPLQYPCSLRKLPLMPQNNRIRSKQFLALNSATKPPQDVIFTTQVPCLNSNAQYFQKGTGIMAIKTWDSCVFGVSFMSETIDHICRQQSKCSSYNYKIYLLNGLLCILVLCKNTEEHTKICFFNEHQYGK